MRNIVEQIEKGEYKINIYQDEDARSPEEDGDDNLFLVGYYRDFTVDRGRCELVTIFPEEKFTEAPDKQQYAAGYGWKSYKEAKAAGLINKQVRRGRYVPGISQDLARSIANNGKDEDGEICYEAQEYLKKYHVFGLEAYIHSDVRLALSREGNFPDRQWDVSQLGLVFASKEEWRLRKSAEKAARALLEYWNDYLSGSVYRYMIETPDGEEVGGCGGFYGYDHTKSGLIESAEAEIEELKKECTEVKEMAQLAGM